MKPQKQPLEINFSGGIDTKTDNKQVQQGKFLALNNSIFDTSGLLRKRNGYKELGNSIIGPPLITFNFPGYGASLASGVLASSYNDELIVDDGLNLYSYSESADKMVYKGRASLNSVKVDPVFQNQYHQILADSAINLSTGYTVYAWESWDRIPDMGGTYQGVSLSLVDNDTNLKIYESTFADTNSRPKCISVGTHLYVVYYDSVATSLKAISLTTAGIVATVTLVNNINTTLPNYDLIVIGGTVYIGYNGTGGTVRIASFNSALSPIANTSQADSASNGIGIFPDASNNIWVAYNNGTDTKAFIMNSALSVVVLPITVLDAGVTNVKNVTGVYDGTQGIIMYDQPGNPALGQITANTVDTNFVQPAVGATVIISTASTANAYVGNIIYITGGGYYYIAFLVPGGDIIGVNLGYPGNATPGSTVSAGATIYPIAGYLNSIIYYVTLTVGGVVGVVRTLKRSCALNSKAFIVNGIANVIGSYGSLIQPSYFLLSLYNISQSLVIHTAAAAAKIFEDVAGGIPFKSILPSVNLDSLGNYNIALPRRIYSIEKTEGGVSSVLFFNGIFNAATDFSPTQITSQEIGKVLLLGTGATLMYDGQEVVEQGFHIFPENITGTPFSGGFLTPNTQYGYQVVYQWIDGNGFIYKSAPSAILSIAVSGSNQGVTLIIPTLRVTEKTNATITIYRTVGNGTIYYRLDTEQISDYPINNNVNVDTIIINDFIADDQIVGNQQLYTPAEVENISPPGATVVTNFRNRAIVIPFDDINEFWYSKQVITGAPVEFSDFFIQPVGAVDGNLITAAPMDDKIILYKNNTIYYMVGTGPSPSGANNDFTDPLLITTDCGAIDRGSVVAMPLGHMFKSAKGIYLLDRGLNAIYIGADVEIYNQYDVLSSRLLESNNQVRFALSSGDVLIYDYYFKQWAVFPGLAPISACIFGGNYTYIKADGTIWNETPGLYLDGTNPVLMSFTTAWIKLAGLQGYQRAFFFYILGEFLSAHSLTLNIAYDYSNTSEQTTLITPENGSSNTLERWRIFLARQRCQAVQISLQENHTSSNGAGFNMSGVQFVLGLKSGFRPTSNANTAS